MVKIFRNGSSDGGGTYSIPFEGMKLRWWKGRDDDSKEMYYPVYAIIYITAENGAIYKFGYKIPDYT